VGDKRGGRGMNKGSENGEGRGRRGKERMRAEGDEERYS